MNHTVHTADVLKVGDEVDVRITEVDFDKKRVSLSMKELLPKPNADEAGVLILSQEIWLMWIRPSIPGRILANAPNDARPTILALQSVPTG